MSQAEAIVPAPGSLFRSEIFEQPAALERLLGANEEIARIAATAVARNVQLVRMVGHGSSDNAASYGVYAFGLLPRWTAVRDSITLTVHYDTPIDLSGSMVIGLSQSGQTPDVVEYLLRARKAGAFTVAPTAAIFPFCIRIAPFLISGPAAVRMLTLRMTVVREGNGT